MALAFGWADENSEYNSPSEARIGLVEVGEVVEDPASLATDRIEVQLKTFARASAAAMYRVMVLVAEYDRRGAYESWECISCARWLELHCHLSRSTSREWVRVARALTGLPVTSAAMSSGDLSYSKVRALTRVAVPATEGELIELAKVMSASNFEAMVRAIERTLRATPDEDSVEALRGATRTDNLDGTITWTLRVDVDEDGLIETAIAHARDDDFETAKAEAKTAAAEAGSDPVAVAKGRGLGLPRIDALLRALSLSIDADADGLAASRYVTVLNVDGGYSTDDRGLVTMGNGIRLDPRMARRLSCDTTIQLIEHGDDGGVRMGRRVRTFTTKQREVIAQRYQTCGFPGCDVNAHRCQFHHIEHWTDGGSTDLDNGIPLCRLHHRAIHKRGWSLWVNKGGEIVATGPDGRRLVAKMPLPPVEPDRESALLRLIEAMGVDQRRLYDQPERCGRSRVADIASTALGNHQIGRFPLMIDGTFRE